MRLFALLFLATGLGLTAFGCTASAPASSAAAADTITVEGTITHRGNEPFTTYVLETEDRNSYVLNLELLPEERRTFSTPLQARATGTLYAGAWGDQTYAHLRVSTMEELTDAAFRQ
jgi:ABC-type glycerol-3-phosphate transport system substrate-binding protein